MLSCFVDIVNNVGAMLSCVSHWKCFIFCKVTYVKYYDLGCGLLVLNYVSSNYMSKVFGCCLLPCYVQGVTVYWCGNIRTYISRHSMCGIYYT
jgi:hypothetical protein